MSVYCSQNELRKIAVCASVAPPYVLDVVSVWYGGRY